MLRVLAAMLVSLSAGGCRFDFDPVPPRDAAPDGIRTLAAPPAVPSAICKVEQFLIDPAPRVADLAIASTREGYAAIWVDTTAGKPAHTMLLGPNHQLIGQRELPEITDTEVGGLADVGDALTLASSSTDTSTGRPAPVMTMRILDRDLTPARVQGPFPRYVVGRAPYPSDVAQTPRAFVTALDDTIELSYVATDGLANLSSKSTFTDGGPITGIACADGPNHAHCTWTVDVGTPTQPASRCNATDVSFGVPTFPETNGGSPMSTDCYDVRDASGPPADDSMIVVWRTQANTIMATYAIASSEVNRTIASYGLAPKIVFDDTRFWIAFVDQTGTLQLTSFDHALATRGDLAHFALAGWIPNGNEAFELVHRGLETMLVVIRSDELDVLTICP